MKLRLRKSQGQNLHTILTVIAFPWVLEFVFSYKKKGETYI